MPTDHEHNDHWPVSGVEPEHVHGPACVTGDLHCPDRIHDEILIKNAADAAFWLPELSSRLGVPRVLRTDCPCSCSPPAGTLLDPWR